MPRRWMGHHLQSEQGIMTIIIPHSYHALQALQKNRVTCIEATKAVHQDIRPLRIGILNIMPRAQDYEFNILHPLGLSIIQVIPVWIRLKGHQYKSSDREYIDDVYVTYEEAMQEGLDGLIVTGAPVELIRFEDVKYWDEISEILMHAKDNCTSTLGLCWGGLCLAYLVGIDKFAYDKKLFGVFELKNLVRYHIFTGEIDEVFNSPQSRHAGIEDSLMLKAEQEGKVVLLAYGEEAGYSIFETPDHRFVMHLGHPEYNKARLVQEYQRDLDRKDVALPLNFDVEAPLNRWKSHRNMFFMMWLKYCYTQISFSE